MCARRFLIAIFILTMLAVTGFFAIFQWGGNVLLKGATPTGHFVADAAGGAPDYSQTAAWISRPGLADDPSHPVARRQMRYFGAVVGFELADAEAAQRFLGSCRLLFEATSFGGVHSSAERRVRWGTDKVGEGFIRLSVGVEATVDIVEAIGNALDRL